jgi:hypothetical protein
MTLRRCVAILVRSVIDGFAAIRSCEPDGVAIHRMASREWGAHAAGRREAGCFSLALKSTKSFE